MSKKTLVEITCKDQFIVIRCNARMHKVISEYQYNCFIFMLMILFAYKNIYCYFIIYQKEFRN